MITAANVKNTKKNTNPDTFIEIKTITTYDSGNDLFDFDNRTYSVCKHHLHESGVFIQENGIIDLFDGKQIKQLSRKSTNEDFQLYIKKRPEKDEFKIKVKVKVPYLPPFNKEIWLIVRSLRDKTKKEQKGYSLKFLDVIKIGKVRLEIIEMQNNSNPLDREKVNNFSILPSESFLDSNLQELEQRTDETCKYCWLELSKEEIQSGEVVYPCKCSGSSRAVHLVCLKTWIEHKVTSTGSGRVINYNLNKFNCEICLSPFPVMIKTGDHIHDLITINRPKGPYIIFRQLFDDQTTHKYSIIMPDERSPITIGRSGKCEMQVNNISISRVHSEIQLINGKFRIFDTNSKFGTLILCKKDIVIGERKQGLQVGTNVFTFEKKTIHDYAKLYHDSSN